jgi:hypothetical protein
MNGKRCRGIEVTIALRVLALDEEALRGRNVGFTANSALHPLDQRCRRRARLGHVPSARGWAQRQVAIPTCVLIPS